MLRILERPSFLTVLFIVFFVPLSLGAKEPRNQFPLIDAGQSANGIIRPGNDGARYRTFRINVPDTALAIRLWITGAEADLDIFVKHGQDIQDYSDVDFYSEYEDWNEDMVIYRLYDGALRGGTYFIDVTYQLSDIPRKEGELLHQIPFTLHYDVVDGRDPVRLQADQPAELVLNPQNSYVNLAAIDVPAGTQALRVDVLDSAGDTDLFLSRERAAAGPEDFLVVADTFLGREHFIYREDGRDLSPGRYYVAIHDAYETEIELPVQLVASFDEDPPAAPRPPELPRRQGGLEEARLATVQIINWSGMGSGCILSEDGYILTNDHVVRSDSGEVVDQLWVAVSQDPFAPPEEWFQGEVVDTSPQDDMALVRITADHWGRSLPRNYRFPHWELGDPENLALGEAVYTLGYPAIGSSLSRPQFTLTRGIVAGGEWDVAGFVIKSDAVISGGGSGGGLADEDFRLLGLSTYVVNDDSTQFAYFMAVSRMPDSWRRLAGLD